MSREWATDRVSKQATSWVLERVGGGEACSLGLANAASRVTLGPLSTNKCDRGRTKVQRLSGTNSALDAKVTVRLLVDCLWIACGLPVDACGLPVDCL